MPRRSPREAPKPGEARRPPRRAHPRSERSTQRVAPHSQPATRGAPRGRSPRPPRRAHPRSERPTQRVAPHSQPATRGAPRGRSPRPPRRAHPRSERPTQRVAPHSQPATRGAPRGRSPRPPRRAHPHHVTLDVGGGPRPAARSTPPARARTAAWNVLSVGVPASAGAGLRPAGAPRAKSDAAWATPETIRWTRLRASRLALRAKRGRSACRTGSLRSRPAGRGRPCGRGSALRASPAEHGRFAPAPRAAGARFTRSALRASLWRMLASLARHDAHRPSRTGHRAPAIVYGSTPRSVGFFSVAATAGSPACSAACGAGIPR